VVYNHSDFDSNTDKCRKVLHVMYGGLLGHHVSSYHQDSTLGGGSDRTGAQVDTPP
jgi:hypothetical protein